MTKRCVNGHYYDGDKFAMCPHCGARDMDSGTDQNPASSGSRDIYSSSAREAEDNKTVKLERPGLSFENAALFGSAASAGVQDDPDATVPIIRSQPSFIGSFNAPKSEEKEPEFKAPETPAPEFKVPEIPVPEFKEPETPVPEFKAPEMTVPEFKAPETPAPEFKAPEEYEPEVKEPEVSEPDFKTLEMSEPEVKEPEMPMQAFTAPEIKEPDAALEAPAPSSQPTVPLPEEFRIPEPAPEQTFRSTEPAGIRHNFTPPPPPVPAYQPPQPQFPQYQPQQPPQYQQQFNYGAAIQNAINNPVAHEDNPTVSLMREKFSTEPVVGWLICVGGNHFGESFELRSGKNLIGRSAQMDIALTDEPTVASNNHAAVIYEPREKCFYVQAGDSKELLYKNDEVLLKNEKLAAYDVLTAGNAKLLFFPLCGEDFSWDKVKEEN